MSCIFYYMVLGVCSHNLHACGNKDSLHRSAPKIGLCVGCENMHTRPCSICTRHLAKIWLWVGCENMHTKSHIFPTPYAYETRRLSGALHIHRKSSGLSETEQRRRCFLKRPEKEVFQRPFSVPIWDTKRSITKILDRFVYF